MVSKRRNLDLGGNTLPSSILYWHRCVLNESKHEETSLAVTVAVYVALKRPIPAEERLFE